MRLIPMNISWSLPRRALAAASAVALGTALAACGALSPSSESSSAASADARTSVIDGKVQVATSFYPIQYLAQSIGGQHVEAVSLTPAGAEPHDYELSPRDVTSLADKAAILYVSGFQPSLDDALAEVSGPTVTDLASVVDLVHHEGVDHDHDADDHGEDGHDHGESDHDHDADDLDPHFWLDPVRMEAAATAVARALSAVDPDHATDYEANLVTLTDSLTKLDDSYTTGLAQCERTTFVTSHSAFGYLADRYRLTQASVSGIDPDAEPSPAEIAAVKKIVADTGTTTIFTEEIVSPKTAQALAAETGTTTAVLSPLESAPQSGDYAEAMTANLTELRTALGCQ
ncbi:metal ABC transporter substrate-binding protein [Actinomyces faecalis]|uniref:metal ABC transporter substrate-binding protein n=1 Tax=Actinomyces faecalis TaxID=2722820 RepID=UPI00155696A3|nr:metal ABC transporter substrate-binding protein [Actinomyces faecalis]